jgi:hypothetical protein
MSLDITWLKDKSLADLDNLPDPDELALNIVENIAAGLESFRVIIASLKYFFNEGFSILKPEPSVFNFKKHSKRWWIYKFRFLETDIDVLIKYKLLGIHAEYYLI